MVRDRAIDLPKTCTTTQTWRRNGGVVRHRRVLRPKLLVPRHTSQISIFHIALESRSFFIEDALKPFSRYPASGRPLLPFVVSLYHYLILKSCFEHWPFLGCCGCLRPWRSICQVFGSPQRRRRQPPPPQQQQHVLTTTTIDVPFSSVARLR